MNRARSIREAVAANLPRRHRAEQRFKVYGLIAVVTAVLFLALLIGSILVQSVPALTAHRLTLPVYLDAQLVDPRGDASEASLRRGSYNAALQTALRDQFPDVEGRAQLRELFGLYSPINAARLLTTVLENPDQVGQTVQFEFPVSDVVDLYLKRASVEERQTAGTGQLTIMVSGDRAELTAETSVFSEFSERLHTAIAQRALAAEADASAAIEAANRLVNLDDRSVLQSQAERARERAGQLRQLLGLESDLELGGRDPSLLLRVEDAVIRVTSIAGDGRSVAGDILVHGASPLESAENWSLWEVETPAASRRITDRQIVFARILQERGLVQNSFNTLLFTNADSREPELAGILGALVGSILTVLVTTLLAVPVGVGAAIYLEEFAPKNRLTAFIEANINNLAAVPSIVFGLLGLAVFINTFGLPRSTPLVAGMVLALMALPTVIISSRASLKAVPPSIREAAIGVGASKTQAVFHHVLPLAFPGMLTGSIIGLAQAVGDTAPLLMIGMVAFVADIPSLGLFGYTQPSTVMPVQVYIWSTSAERAFEARTAVAILALLGMMILFNAVAIYLRLRYQRRW